MIRSGHSQNSLKRPKNDVRRLFPPLRGAGLGGENKVVSMRLNGLETTPFELRGRLAGRASQKPVQGGGLL